MLRHLKIFFLSNEECIYKLKFIANDIDVLLYWDSSDLKMEMVNGALQKQDWNSDKFWNAKFANIDFYL